MWSVNSEGNKSEEYTKEYHFTHFAWRECGSKGTCVHCGGMKWYIHIGKQCGFILQSWALRVPCEAQSGTVRMSFNSRMDKYNVRGGRGEGVG